ncbi:hypothetical protein [Micromonospora sp. HM5-17]|uniref:hypothetical protein n=1 Tax=Micromonospora sp. HM5-17 TaxID=2487710 RepID=UPI001F2CC256|nr:hypothetical protein [Micromonospora sp. HM5-17]
MNPTPSSSGSQASPGASWAAGPVTRLGTPTLPPIPPAGPPTVPPSGSGGGGDRRRLWWFGGAAGAVLVIGLVVVLALTLTGRQGASPFEGKPRAAEDVRPPLARRCPPLAGSATPTSPARPADPAPEPRVPPGAPGQPLAGERTVDREAGISYPAYGAPWRPWRAVWNAGSLQVPYKVGQHFVTEEAYDGFSDYHASILSAAVPAAENDALTFDLECVGRQVAHDARTEYYPQPNRMEPIRDERTTLDGRPAWVTVFRLHFRSEGLRATDELVAIACIDVGKPSAAVLYVSVPGTHRQFDWVVDHALASVQVL